MRLIRSKFKAWLKSKPVEEIVGESRECHSCPIALFYREATKGHEVVISSGRQGNYVIDRGDGERQLPWWAYRFVLAVDNEDNKISAARALEVLKQC